MYKTEKTTKLDTFNWVRTKDLSAYSQNYHQILYGLDFAGNVEDLQLFDEAPFCNNLEGISYVENLITSLNSEVLRYVSLINNLLPPESQMKLNLANLYSNTFNTHDWLEIVKLFFIHALSDEICILILMENGFSFEGLDTMVEKIAELELCLGYTQSNLNK